MIPCDMIRKTSNLCSMKTMVRHIVNFELVMYGEQRRTETSHVESTSIALAFLYIK